MATLTAPLIVVFIIAGVSLLLVRVGARALMMTGLSWEASLFQSASAFFGVGFTTREAELVVNHPIRRRIVTHLIVLGNVGLTTALASLIVALMDAEESEQHTLTGTLGLVFAGFLVLWMLWRLRPLQQAIDALIKLTLVRSGVARVLDYSLVLRVHHGYSVSEVEVDPESWLANHSIADLQLSQRGVLVLGVTDQKGGYNGAPGGTTVLEPHSVLTVYGTDHDLRALLRDLPSESHTTHGAAASN